MPSQEETSLAKEMLPSCLLRIQEVIGRDRVGWFLRMLEDIDGFSNWKIRDIMLAAFGIDLSPWVIKVWRDAALRPVPTLLPELQRYKEQPLTLIEGEKRGESTRLSPPVRTVGGFGDAA